ncbi:MAG TPA: SPOR domain-containing protein [Clostridiales bacterium]|nr:SPOR domain-containing protein [Clostridiales bacterium]
MFLRMNTIRMTVYIFVIILYLSAAVAECAQRSEMSAEFTASEYRRDEKIFSGVPKVDPQADMPELFDRKYTFSEHSRSDSILQEINGFRIQIFRTEDLNEAKRRESLYITTFGEENVTLIFEPPFYKIRIGKFRNKEEAEQFQQTLGWRGISETLIVPDRVSVLMPVKKQ